MADIKWESPTVTLSTYLSTTLNSLADDTYDNGGSDVITAGSKTDCLTIDPVFANTDRNNNMSGFVATNKYTAGGNSSPFRTADYGYMGWKAYDFANWNMRNTLRSSELMRSFRIR